eukprot:CAMPEP_0202007812 /NCGR_PEP_ID=MMETSP0905-20130828/12187_1 /ASSEMBLY_ACC=CAM_ASM_000554 /TAXON_ID=420261 /ORGANISM="Thalassiosira antarctica, Strain CCMP982" /LENGTH=212 /DNA_ID=CAMNT_0048565829 /DNA_START=28 /DNA_END=666 /DNA_ORIENTATION=+
MADNDDPQKKRRHDTAATELQACIDKSKSVPGPVYANPAIIKHLAAANRDIDQLNLTQLEHERVRLAARATAVQERITHLLATGKRPRTKCNVTGCTNIAQKGGVCRTHGAPCNHKRCSSEGCNNKSQRGGVCYTHGAPYKLCLIEGCTSKVQQGGLCFRHGAKRLNRKCSYDGCMDNALKFGRCERHHHGQANQSEEEGKEEESGVEDYQS